MLRRLLRQWLGVEHLTIEAFGESLLREAHADATNKRLSDIEQSLERAQKANREQQIEIEFLKKRLGEQDRRLSRHGRIAII